MTQVGETIASPRTGKRGRPRKPFKRWPEGASDATVNKTYRKGGVAAVARKLVHGTRDGLASALAASSSSNKINTAFVERHQGTDRAFNARKRRKTYELSKVLLVHFAVSWWVLSCYNFHHLHPGLRRRLSDGSYLDRTPAMAFGIADRSLSLADIATTQVVGFGPSSATTPSFPRLRHAAGPAPQAGHHQVRLVPRFVKKLAPDQGHHPRRATSKASS